MGGLTESECEGWERVCVSVVYGRVSAQWVGLSYCYILLPSWAKIIRGTSLKEE